MGQGQHNQLGGSQQGLPIAPGTKGGPAHHRTRFEALQRRHPFAQPRSHHHRTGTSLQQEKHLLGRLGEANDRLTERKAQQLALGGESFELFGRLIRQKGEGTQQFKELSCFRHGSAPLRWRHG